MWWRHCWSKAPRWAVASPMSMSESDVDVTLTLNKDDEIDQVSTEPVPTNFEAVVNSLLDTRRVTLNDHRSLKECHFNTLICLTWVGLSQIVGVAVFYITMWVVAADVAERIAVCSLMVSFGFMLDYYYNDALLFLVITRQPLLAEHIAMNAGPPNDLFFILSFPIGLLSGIWLAQFDPPLPRPWTLQLLTTAAIHLINPTIAPNRQNYMFVIVGPAALLCLFWGLIRRWFGYVSLFYMAVNTTVSVVIMQLYVGRMIIIESTVNMSSVAAELTVRCMLAYITGRPPVPTKDST